jgi:hypothetical protein
VFFTVNPLIVIQLRPEITNPLDCPVTVTWAPGAAVKTMGALGVPDLEIVTFSGYVPPATCTVCPGTTFAAAPPMVQKGLSCAPDPEFEQLELAPST